MLPFFIETRFRLILGWYFYLRVLHRRCSRSGRRCIVWMWPADWQWQRWGRWLCSEDGTRYCRSTPCPGSWTHEPDWRTPTWCRFSRIFGRGFENSSRVFVLVFLKTDQRRNWRDKFTLPQPSQLRAWEARWLGRQTDKEIERGEEGCVRAVRAN